MMMSIWAKSYSKSQGLAQQKLVIAMWIQLSCYLYWDIVIICRLSIAQVTQVKFPIVDKWKLLKRSEFYPELPSKMKLREKKGKPMYPNR